MSKGYKYDFTDYRTYKCTSCGRTMHDKSPHLCNGQFRKHHLNFKKREETISESLRMIVSHDLINPMNEESEFLENPPLVIEEGLIRTYPIETSISAFAKVYHLSVVKDRKEAYRKVTAVMANDDDNFNGTICKEKSSNDTERIMMILGDSQYNKNVATHYLEKYGYVLANEQNLYQGWKLFAFEKKFDNDATDIVENIGELYHICKMSIKDKILKNGLTPHASQWKSFNNGPRCYFFLPISNQQLNNWVMNFRLKKGHLKENYMLLRIDVEKLNGIKFYSDPRMENAVYTLEGIPPTALEIIEENITGKLS